MLNPLFWNKAKKLAVILTLIVISNASIYSQTTYDSDTVKMTQLFEDAISDDGLVLVRNKIISTAGLEFIFDQGIFEYLTMKGYEKDSADRVTINQMIDAYGIELTDDNPFIIFKNLHFKRPLILSIASDNDKVLVFDNCILADDIDVRGVSILRILDSKFYGETKFDGKEIDIVGSQWERNLQNYRGTQKARIEGSKEILISTSGDFGNDNLDVFLDTSLVFGRPQLRFAQTAEFSVDDGGSLNFLRNDFLSEELQVRIVGGMNELDMEENKFVGLLNLSNSNVSDRLQMSKNSLKGYLDISKTVFPEVYNKIRWTADSQFDLTVETNYRLPLYDIPPDSLGLQAWNIIKNEEEMNFFEVGTPYTGITDAEISNDLIFDLKRSYFTLYNIYKANVDQESANLAYSKMMDIEGSRLKYKFASEGGFKNYFRWKLSQLLKFYVDYGTDPAKAILISVYLIIFFAVFYFFFPSEWDRKSKLRLIKDYRTFIQKNEHGYLKPFFVMVGGFGLSLVNALTLSLNAFVTLGFGTIPTRGLARYVCVIQGFLGWFLLSIFTVALINQVLA